MTITSRDFQKFRQHQGRRYRLAWTAVVAISTAGFFAVGVAWSYLAGLVWALVFPLIGYEGLKQWNRRCWVSHFPELNRMDFQWIPDAAQPPPSDPGDVMRPKRD